MPQLADLIRERLNLRTIAKRDYVLSGICALIGFLVSFVPGNGHDMDKPGVHEWLRLYWRSTLYMTSGPRIFITIAVCALLLISARFKRGGLGVAYVIGILLGRVVNSGW